MIDPPTPTAALQDRLRLHAYDLVQPGGTNASDLRNDLNAAAEALSASERSRARLREALEPFTTQRGPGEWGRYLAWIVNGAPTRDEGIAAAQKIQRWRVTAEEALRTADAPPAPPKKENTVIDKHKAGLYRKYDVQRTDGSDGPGGKHQGCNYFVLDLTHDPHAIPALRAYAESCRADYPTLSDELMAIVEGNPYMPARTEMAPAPRWMKAADAPPAPEDERRYTLEDIDALVRPHGLRVWRQVSTDTLHIAPVEADAPPATTEKEVHDA